MDWAIVGPCCCALAFIISMIFVWKELRFHWKFYSFFSFGFLFAVLGIPATLLRPCDVENTIYVARVITCFLHRLIGVNYELRGHENLALEGGFMLATNHQHMVDLYGLFHFQDVAKRVAIIMKKELSYHPAGLAVKMYGVVFLDRSSKQSTRAASEVNQWAHDARDKKYKIWIHPEGTRYFESFKSQCLLPFKVGSFHAAIAAQIPILPLVFSPYYFINYHERVFGRGRVIMDVLPPVSTTGMTKDDVPKLLEHVRKIMTERYRALTKEILSTLPPSHPVFGWIEDTD